MSPPKSSPEPQTRSPLRNLLIAASAGLIFFQVLILNPSRLEMSAETSSLDTDDLMTLFYDRDESKSPGVPKDQIPDYTIDQFKTISVQLERKQWKLLAERAYMYNSKNLVHTTQIYAEIYDEQGKITVVTSDEGVTGLDERNLEFYGHVHATFPDGFVMKSDYLMYNPKRGEFDIPASYWVLGLGQSKDGGNYDFKSRGLEFKRERNKVLLREAVTFNSYAKKTKDRTTIRSDYCEIDRALNRARFKMFEWRPHKQRYVLIEQPDLEVKGRLADLNFSRGAQANNYLIAREDVRIRETGNDQSVRYGTCGKAEFFQSENKIVLTEFPQVYQDQDTVTGEVIVMYRDTDTVEVEQSNAYSTGKKP